MITISIFFVSFFESRAVNRTPFLPLLRNRMIPKPLKARANIKLNHPPLSPPPSFPLPCPSLLCTSPFLSFASLSPSISLFLFSISPSLFLSLSLSLPHFLLPISIFQGNGRDCNLLLLPEKKRE